MESQIPWKHSSGWNSAAMKLLEGNVETSKWMVMLSIRSEIHSDLRKPKGLERSVHGKRKKRQLTVAREPSWEAS